MAARTQAVQGAGAGACHVYHFAELIADRLSVHGHYVGCSQRQANDLQLKLNRRYESSSMAHGAWQ